MLHRVKSRPHHLRFLLPRVCSSSAAVAFPTPAVRIPVSLSPIDESQLLRVCTVLYQQHKCPSAKLNTSLSEVVCNLNHEFFLQVCCKFSYSWCPVYKFHLFAVSQLHFAHTTTTFNKMLDVVGKSRNIELFCDLCQEIGKLHLVNVKTYIIALRTLAAARELKKCVQFFHLMNGFGYDYEINIFNKVVEFLCRNKFVVEASHIVVKLKDWVKPDVETYRWLVYGFCHLGDLIEASKAWNLMVDEGLKPDVRTVDTILETLFKNNRLDEALKLFQSIRAKRMEELGVSTYGLVIEWLCKRGKVAESYAVFEEMQMVRGLKADNKIMGWIIYGLLSRGRVMEAHKVLEEVEMPDITVYNGMIKGLLRLKRASEATKVFREMIKHGCEPTMHTYIMLLQVHLGKRGRKGEDPLVNFDTIFVGGLVKAGKSLDATKYIERVMDRRLEVPRFNYNKFLHCFSNEEGVAMFESMAAKLREVGLFDLADIFERYGEKMATRDRRRIRSHQLNGRQA